MRGRIPSTIGLALRKRRTSLGLSQAQVAAASAKSQPQIARMELGTDDPRFSSLVQVARSLGAEVVLVPNRFLPAVRHMMAEKSAMPDRLVGNGPEDAEEGLDAAV